MLYLLYYFIHHQRLQWNMQCTKILTTGTVFMVQMTRLPSRGDLVKVLFIYFFISLFILMQQKRQSKVFKNQVTILCNVFLNDTYIFFSCNHSVGPAGTFFLHSSHTCWQDLCPRLKGPDQGPNGGSIPGPSSWSLRRQVLM